MNPETLEEYRLAAYEFSPDFSPEAAQIVLALISYIEELRAEVQDYGDFLMGLYGDILEYEDEVTQEHIKGVLARRERLLWGD